MIAYSHTTCLAALFPPATFLDFQPVPYTKKQSVLLLRSPCAAALLSPCFFRPCPISEIAKDYLVVMVYLTSRTSIAGPLIRPFSCVSSKASILIRRPVDVVAWIYYVPLFLTYYV